MASSNPKADRLAKSLQLCLSQSLGGITRLRQLGWFDLLQEEWPRTEIAARIACEALFHLGLDDADFWDGNPAIVVGVVNFMKQESNRFPTSVALSDLKKLLETAPVNRIDVEEWFAMVYSS